MLMIAGPNGSGKTTLTRQLVEEGRHLGVYINPDDIAAALSGRPLERSVAAQVESERRRQQCISELRSFTFETVMSHPSKIDLIWQAREAGFRVGLFFVCTESPELNVARVRQRVSMGGHEVPAGRIRARYARSTRLLPGAVGALDQLVLFDNTSRLDRGGAVIMRPFAEYNRGPPTASRIDDPIPKWGEEAVMAIRYWAEHYSERSSTRSEA